MIILRQVIFLYFVIIATSTSAIMFILLWCDPFIDGRQ